MLRVGVMTLLLATAAMPVMAEDKAADSAATPAPAAAPAGDPVVAKVNGMVLHRSEVLKELQALGPQAQQMPPQMLYPQLLQKMIITKLVAKQGYDQKLQDSAEVKERLKAAEAQIVADVYIRKTIQPKITDAKIKARYDEWASKIKPEDEVRARHILVPTEDEAKDLIKQIKDGADFAKLAADKSKDSGSAKQGGDLGYFTRSSMVKPFSDAAFDMKTGELSDKPVKTDFGYHVIKVEDRRKSTPAPLAEMKDQLGNQIGQELVTQLVKDLETKAKIEKFNLDGTPMKVADSAKEGSKK